ncbi:Golgi-specific brefeldin A-resistance guanine nucleotide exchange factor 1 isoform X1 [Drosophila sechellia]|uniref:Golgi-specific brefeldin A-resistance guanine nucleotide exchange factor 1 n=1 Tax=Drosophila sechellia TaxID=7238 RepID=B4HP89_DROSE|nr:Golgi-specific brefeldin A-resistance guanine nucleotide exchange factor 1 isoform X1 [Drosophila sechellia]EDW47538.1 GM21360 [Drosophila sechellia]
MALPGNGIYVVRGEMATLMTAMRRGTRWNATAYVDDEDDLLLKLFIDLKHELNRIEDLRQIEPQVFLAPFLEVIRTADATGPLTSLALASINKFLSYGLIDPTSPNLADIVERIADAVTHARFMGTDQSSDGVTFMRVIEVLHTLIRSPEGAAVSNSSMCEVMLSCFKICFEPRLSELLRRSAEKSLKDMVLLFFMRLPQFAEERSDTMLQKRFTIGDAASGATQEKLKRKTVAQAPTAPRKSSAVGEPPQTPQSANLTVPGHLKAPILATTPASPAGNILDMQGKITQTPTTTASTGEDETTVPDTPVIQVESTDSEPLLDGETGEATSTLAEANSSEYINSVGVRFTQQSTDHDVTSLSPYGLPFIQELFRFLITLSNPLDKQNSDSMMHTGLSLLTVAFEVAADNIGKYEGLLELVKDDLCRNLISLLSSERLSIFAANLQLCFLLFESLRGHLKFQLEAYLRKLSEIIASDNPKTPYEMRELALDNLLQLWRIPGFVTELYINYDCDLYCTDMFESLTNLLSKYTLSATNAVYSTHIISMDTLLSVIDSIERNCAASKNSSNNRESLPEAAPATGCSRHSRHNSGLEGIVIDSGNSVAIEEKVENIASFINASSQRLRLQSGGEGVGITSEQLANVKQKKRLLSQGTERFNQRPEKGIQYLQEHGILNAELDPMQVALFLRENPGLDKKMIGEYISKKKNVDSKILINFVDSFDFTGLRVDQALRLYLETFRLPGEAPLIFLVLEHFSDHWHKQNQDPFANVDAAFRLAYAIIMLNMDQHNSNAKRLNVPMTLEDFTKNLRGLNGGEDFDQEMLAQVFNAIKNEEIVMPAEQTGLVRENYQWKVLLRRGDTHDGHFHYVHDASYDVEIFNIVWGASLSALSFMFDKSTETGYQKTLAGFSKSAAISAHYNLHSDFDALVLTLCKFTTLLSSVEQHEPAPANNETQQAVNFGLNGKAQAAMRTVFLLVHDYGDCLRESWKHILDLYLQLFRLKLLPKSLIEVEDFCEANGKATLILEKPREKQESGLFSSLYSFISSEGQREPTYEEQDFIKLGRKCIKECQLDQMLQESKFVQLESLQELLKCVLALLKAPQGHKSIGLPYAEDQTVFWMEFLVKIVVHNRDRMIPLWPAVRDQMYLLLMGSASCGYDYLLNRCIVAVLKLAIYLMRNEELCPIVLQSLKMLLMLKPALLLRISKQISIGIYELLKTSAQNIHSEQDWQIIFNLLECVGAGAVPPSYDDAQLPLPPNGSAKSDGAISGEEDATAVPERGYTSDSEITKASAAPAASSPSAENWILVNNKDSELTTASRPQSPPSLSAPPVNTLVYSCQLLDHAPFALFKCWDSLAFIVRSVAHITPYNFEACVRCIRIFVEACRDGGIRQRRKLESMAKQKSSKKRSERKPGMASSASSSNLTLLTGDPSDNQINGNAAEQEDLAQRYEQLSIQLLDLMYTLYTRTAQIFRWWAEEGCTVPQSAALWSPGWCPLLQGIARLAMDRRREVRTHAISCLQQRALLVHDLQTLSGTEWCSCFHQVLFPLLNELLPESNAAGQLDAALLEESRIRTATIMSKVFLQHLTTLIELGNAFNELWLDILDYIERFMKVGSDTLSEQMQEILKNMLLVMHSVRVFHNQDGSLQQALWELTWRRIGEFLPNLKEELFHDEGKRAQTLTNPAPLAAVTAAPQQQVPAVTILPRQTQASNELVVSAPTPPAATPLLGSPVESPRRSIILQPPMADALQQPPSFVFAQPIIVPPQPPAVTDPIPPSTLLPDLVNEATAAAVQATTTSPTHSPQEAEQPASIVQQTNIVTTNNTYNSYAIEVPMAPETTAEQFGQQQQQLLYQQYYQQYQAQQQQLPAPASDPAINVPISHLLAGNAYPSLPKMPQASIVHSFAPVYESQAATSGAGPAAADIYQEYVQNPYNLTLQQHPQQQRHQQQQQQQAPGMATAFPSVATPANYFNVNVDPSSIPPGSELLYGQQ